MSEAGEVGPGEDALGEACTRPAGRGLPHWDQYKVGKIYISVDREAATYSHGRLVSAVHTAMPYYIMHMDGIHSHEQ